VNATAEEEEEKKLIDTSVRMFRTSKINASTKALLDQGDPGDENYIEPEYPTPYITELTQTGWMEITFSHDVQIVPNTSMITNGTIEVDEEVGPVLYL